jgi:hypothetical protein
VVFGWEKTKGKGRLCWKEHLMMNHTPPVVIMRTRGLLGMFRLDEINDRLAVDLANLRPGEFTMLRLDDGYQIIRLDARISATPRSYEDPEMRAEISRFLKMSRATAICKSYIAHLREKARIEICPDR